MNSDRIRRRWTFTRVLAVAVLAFGCVVASWFVRTTAAAQSAPRITVSTSQRQPDLQQITQRAGTIFLGRVEKVEWKRAQSAGTADRVLITFRVLDGIRGARTGEVLTVEEWSGLWTPGHDRYHAGETLFLFLYPRSRLGLTSPVGGDAGRVEITPTQRVVLSPDAAASLLPRSLRLQKNQSAVQTLREQYSGAYAEFAQMVRELAGVQP